MPLLPEHHTFIPHLYVVHSTWDGSDIPSLTCMCPPVHSSAMPLFHSPNNNLSMPAAPCMHAIGVAPTVVVHTCMSLRNISTDCSMHAALVPAREIKARGKGGRGRLIRQPVGFIYRIVQSRRMQAPRRELKGGHAKYEALGLLCTAACTHNTYNLLHQS